MQEDLSEGDIQINIILDRPSMVETPRETDGHQHFDEIQIDNGEAYSTMDNGDQQPPSSMSNDNSQNQKPKSKVRLPKFLKESSHPGICVL